MTGDGRGGRDGCQSPPTGGLGGGSGPGARSPQLPAVNTRQSPTMTSGVAARYLIPVTHPACAVVHKFGRVKFTEPTLWHGSLSWPREARERCGVGGHMYRGGRRAIGRAPKLSRPIRRARSSKWGVALRPARLSKSRKTCRTRLWRWTCSGVRRSASSSAETASPMWRRWTWARARSISSLAWRSGDRTLASMPFAMSTASPASPRSTRRGHRM